VKLRRFSVALGACFAFGLPLSAELPRLAVYVTDADEDVYVAIYGGAAVELTGCSGPEQARALLQLPADAPATETTLARLVADFALRAHPRLPCGSTARFDADWPATTPVWADLTASGNYLLPAPQESLPSYAVPARCTGIKSALAIRERLQLPGVLQGLAAPPGVNLRLLLDCGSADGSGEGPAPVPAPTAALTLHRFETFLSAESTGETIFVARYRPTATGAPPVYLPIWRVDGRAVAAILLGGGALADETESALERLFGLPVSATATPLGAEAVAGVRSAVHVDLCLSACAGYVHHHAAFLDPAADLGLTEIGPGGVSQRLTRLGESQLVWQFGDGREAAFTTCDPVVAALGLPAPAATDWLSSVESALNSEPGSGDGFTCGGDPAGTCIRRLAEGTPLTATTFAGGPDCTGAKRLRVELPAAVQAPGPIVLGGGDFQSIELVPKAGTSRSTVTGVPGRLASGASSCILSSTLTLLFADRLPRLELRRVQLASATGASADEVVAIGVQAGALILDGATLGAPAEGTRALTRGVALCLADLYAVESSVHAQALGIQAVSARILLTGTSTTPALVAEPRFGLLLSADSALRLDHARIRARTPLVLRGGRTIGTRSELAPGSESASDSTALQLERGAAAVFTTSSAGGFRCVASFADAGSQATFILPGNDLVRDNSHLACGAPGRFSLLE
jgi:hypothetical protein